MSARPYRESPAAGAARVARVLRVVHTSPAPAATSSACCPTAAPTSCGSTARASSWPARPRARCSSTSRPAAAALGVRFGPGAAGAALGVAARELRDRTVALAGRLGRAGDASWPSAWPPRRRRAASRVLAAAVARRLDGRPRPRRARRPRERPAGRGMPVAAASREVALTDRHLRRRFHDAVGYGPKTLQRVLRLRRFLALAESGAERRPRPRRGRGGLLRPAAPHARVRGPGGPASGGAAGVARRRLTSPPPSAGARGTARPARAAAPRRRAAPRRSRRPARRSAGWPAAVVAVRVARPARRWKNERSTFQPMMPSAAQDGAPAHERAAARDQARVGDGVPEVAVAVGGEQRRRRAAARARRTGSHAGRRPPSGRSRARRRAAPSRPSARV